MSTLTWSNDYHLNIPAIDNAHKLLISIINEIAHSMQSHNSLQVQIISGSLHSLSKYIRAHFASEERFLMFNNYPDFTQHKQEHDELIVWLDRFISRFEATNRTFDDTMLLELKDWLVRHIILHDCKFANYFRNRELDNHVA